MTAGKKMVQIVVWWKLIEFWQRFEERRKTQLASKFIGILFIFFCLNELTQNWFLNATVQDASANDSIFKFEFVGIYLWRVSFDISLLMCERHL